MSAATRARTVTELLRLSAEEKPDAEFISYPDPKFNYTHFSASDINKLSSQVAVEYSQYFTVRESSASPAKIIAILGASDITYPISIFAFQKLHFTALLLSTRLSDAAYAHLFEKTGCRDIVVQPQFAATIARVQAIFPEKINIHTMASLTDVSKVAPDAVKKALEFEKRFDPTVEHANPAWIIHSSGSTGLPKPVGQTHAAAMASASALVTATGGRTGYITLPFFHSYGTFALISALQAKRKLILHNTDVPITPQNMIQAFRLEKPEVFYGVPYSHKLLSELEEGMEWLKKCDLVISGGSSCPEELGNRLVENGVKLVSFYGSTEAGGLMTSTRDMDADKEWSWLQPTPSASPYCRMESRGGNMYELVVLPGWDAKVYTNRDDGSYATRDLFEKHPTHPNKWRYVSRLDDTIVLSNGEKANPLPLEGAIRQCPLVQEVVVAGAERTSLSPVIVPFKDMPREEFINAVWKWVEMGNEQVPGYAKITREAILILPAGTKYPQTDKGTAIRAAFLREFELQISEHYDSLESSENDPNAGLKLSREETKEFVRDAFIAVLDLEDPSVLKDDTDVFNLGLDSLQSVALWRKIVRELNTGGKKVSQNIAFEKPTVSSLAEYLYALRTGEEVRQTSVNEVMQQLIDKYSTFPKHVPGNAKADGEYIVLTGATGSLGAHLVHQLVTRPTVRKVYCLNRASSPEKAHERTIASLKERQVYNRISAEQLAKVESFASDLSQETLGLTPATFSLVAEKVTRVFHCAWSVNFNMDVTSFETHHIRGTWNLLNLCLKSPQATPAAMAFCSSVSTVAASPERPIPEALPPSFDCTMPMGYGRSKLVAEHICANAAKQTGMAARVCRVGQVAGDTVNGIWNPTEAIPLTIQAAKTIGKLPFVPGDEKVSWLPVDVVAATMIECTLFDKLEPNMPLPPKDAVFAVQHPLLISWNNDFLPALKEAGLEFEAVDQREWVKALENSPQDPVANPPTKLMEFFKGRYNKEGGEMIPPMSTSVSCTYSPSLRECKAPDAELLKKFLKYWQSNVW